MPTIVIFVGVVLALHLLAGAYPGAWTTSAYPSRVLRCRIASRGDGYQGECVDLDLATGVLPTVEGARAELEDVLTRFNHRLNRSFREGLALRQRRRNVWTLLPELIGWLMTPPERRFMVHARGQLGSHTLSTDREFALAVPLRAVKRGEEAA